MPVITARILKGRGGEIKRRLVSALTVAVVDVLDVPLQSVTVVIDEYDRENWATGGELHADRQSAAKTDEVDLDSLFRKPPAGKPTPSKASPKSAAKAPPRKAAAKSRSRR
jgi:4-oxalocrotonate tautomerase